MELDSESPCFEKTMTHTMLQRNDRVLIPVSFIRTHGRKLDTMISLSLTGPNGQVCTVKIKTYPPVRGTRQTEIRHFLGSGWKEFVKENGFQVGDCVHFKLVGNSCFHVLFSSKLQENAVVKATPLSKCEKERGLGKFGFPQFTTKLSRSNVHSRAIRLEIPYRFAKEYGHKFQELVCLLGPNGQRRIVKIEISSTFRTSIRVQFRNGWRAFALENGFTEGDVLQLSLVEFSKFRVQVLTVQYKVLFQVLSENFPYGRHVKELMTSREVQSFFFLWSCINKGLVDTEVPLES